jgi:hypothetical protein
MDKINFISTIYMTKNKNKSNLENITETNEHPTSLQNGGTSSIFSFLTNGFDYINNHVMYLNNSKFFAGVVMILLNVGSKFISIQFSKSTEEYFKSSLTRQILIFAMAWMGTRDIYVALALTAIFVVLSDHLFNEESSYCIVPHNYRILHKIVDANGDGQVSDAELNTAIMTLEKSKQEKQRKKQKEAFSNFQYTVLDKNT